MGRRSQRDLCLRRAVFGATFVLALLARPALAKPWAQWAPAPLASDSAYAALSARSADSLDTGEFAWITVQREWRAERDKEATGSPVSSSLTAAGYEHRARSADGRFSALASQPYSSLSNREFAWLVAESAAQREDRKHMSSDGTVALVVIVAVVAGAVGAIWGVHAAFESIFHWH